MEPRDVELFDLSSCVDEGSFQFSGGRRHGGQVNGAAPAAEPAAEAIDEEVLEAPERGSVDELLDAGAHDELDAMRHSAAHVMAEAVLDLFPGK